MMNTHDAAPFSIAVALPTYLKSLVERMLQGVLREQQEQGLQWYLCDTANADVTVRMLGEGSQAISPNLLAEVRRRDGSVDQIKIEGPWRTGAMALALTQIADLLRARPAQEKSSQALQWLQRWCELRAQPNPPPVELRIGGRLAALLNARQASMQFTERSTAVTPEQCIAAMLRDGWSLQPAPVAAVPTTPSVSLKPLLWQLGLQSGTLGALPELRSSGALRLKGWPYLAAGGHPSFAELIKHLRSGNNNRATLQTLALAPRAVVDGFLNACLACEFFHEGGAAVAVAVTAPAPVTTQAASIARSGDEQAIISAIRRTLGMGRQ
jgi:hypothetical protein